MKFLVDAQLPPGLCRWLIAQRHEAEHVFEIGLGAASDSIIAHHAERTNAILISKDEDFLRLQRPELFVLLWLRCGNTTYAALAAWLETRWQPTALLLETGEQLVELR